MQPKTLSDHIRKLVGESPEGCPTERICKVLGRTPQELGSAFEYLKTRQVIYGYAGVWATHATYQELSGRMDAALAAQHEREPNRAWFRPEQVAKQADVKWAEKPLDRLLSQMADENRITISEQGIRGATVRLSLTPKQELLLNRAVEILEEEPVNTPTPHLIARALGLPHHAIEEVLKLGLLNGRVLQLDEVVFYTPAQLEKIMETMRAWYGTSPFVMTDFRDRLETTRKYAMPLLDYFDSVGFTRGNNFQRRIL